jgi:hypothetical protein
MLVSSSLVLAAGFSIADEHEGDGDGPAPVELYTCKYAEGKGPADLDAVVAKWNAWADGREVSDYSAWTLTPFYAGENQDFDIAWMGTAPTGQALGTALDDWIANGAEMQAAFDSVVPCDSHSMFAAIQFKEPPQRDDPSKVFISFSDCSIGEGKSFTDDLAPALTAWSEYRSGQGSTAGYWVFFPVHGGGGEEFDFKFIASFGSLAEQGTDFDNYDSGKARELLPAGLVDCDSSRVYIAHNRRMAAGDDE